MTEAYLEATLQEGKEIWRFDAPFDKALVALREKGVEQPTAMHELANARTQFGLDHSLNKNGSYCLHGFVYAKGVEPIIVRISPLVSDRELAEQAVEANRNGRYFATPTKELYDRFRAQAEKDKGNSPLERREIILPSRKNFQIQPGEETFEFLFEGGKEYLSHIGRSKLTVYLVNPSTIDSQEGTLATQSWLHRIDNDSGVDGDDWNLSYYDAVRGVRIAEGDSGEASAQKISNEEVEARTYTTRQIETYRNILQGVRKGDLPASKLEQLIPIIESLPRKR